MVSRKCARPGCRAWAMRDLRFCYSHRHDELTADDAPERAPERLARSDAYARAVRSGRDDLLVDRAVAQVIARVGADRSLEGEIGALRIVLRRVIALDALDGDAQATAATVARLVDSIVRAVRTQRQISGDLADDLADAITTVLIELGLGEES